MPEITSGAVALARFSSWTVRLFDEPCAVSGKSSGFGVRTGLEKKFSDEPVTATVCVGELVVITTAPENIPTDVGAKFTVTVQEAPEAIDDPQVFV